jgi:hypothetical protein
MSAYDPEDKLGRAAAGLTEPDQMELILSEGRSLREAGFLIDRLDPIGSIRGHGETQAPR